MWIVSMTPEYVNYIMWVSQNDVKYSFIMYTVRLTFENLGGVILPAVFIKIIIHPITIHKTQCSSQHYSLKILLIATYSNYSPTLFPIHTSIDFSSFLSFPMKVRWWRPMSI